ncbi:MAG TPA: sporulation peptidase YabG [Clostridiaceae bacterium]|nr:sporulation peptidase YabG [Clostridiaceae bacterium]
MYTFKVGDIVARKSYGGDIPFVISSITQDENGKPVYILKGLVYRIEADAREDDLVRPNLKYVYMNMQRYMNEVTRYASTRLYPRGRYALARPRYKPGKILHIDSSSDFLERCLRFYRDSGLKPVGELASESRQPEIVRRLLEKHKPDILVVTGHDSIKKNSDKYNINSYSNSKYFVQSVREARKYQMSYDKLCIFAGACQSYYEAIMSAGANFASSPGRILINALDPAIVAEKIALTDSRMVVTPQEIAKISISGSKGIGGINTKGQMIVEDGANKTV